MMGRRRFVRTVTGALAAGYLAACGGRRGRDERAGAAAAGAMSADGYRAARRYAELSFGRIAYVEQGQGEAALFLHGFPLNAFQWRGAIPPLSRYRRCIAPDFMAMGYTEVAAGQSVAPDAQVEMLAALLDELDAGRVDVIANDSGGQAAQLFLARHPDRVRTLLLTNCDTEIDSPPAALLPVIELAKNGAFVERILAPQLADPEIARSGERGIARQCYVDPAHPTDEAVRYYFGPLASSPARRALTDRFAVALERNPLIGLEPVLRESPVPIRIVWGTGDAIFKRESPDYLDRTFGVSRGVRYLPGRKVFWPEELPEVVVEEARRLWDV